MRISLPETINGVIHPQSMKHTNSIARATSHATFGTMLFEFWASDYDAGPQHCPKRHVGHMRGKSRGQSRWCVLRFILVITIELNHVDMLKTC